MKQSNCPSCRQQDQYVIKSGFNHTGSQRYRCPACCRYFTPDPKPEGYDVSVRAQALKLYLEGTNLRAIGRLLGLHHQTVSNWISQAAAALPPQITGRTPTETIVLDELYPCVQQKKPRLHCDGGGPRHRTDRGASRQFRSRRGDPASPGGYAARRRAIHQ